MGDRVGGEHKQLYNWQDADKTAAVVNSFRKKLGSDDAVVKVDAEGKTYEVPNTAKERGFLQKMWSAMTGDGWK